jgi:hypothetical protein
VRLLDLRGRVFGNWKVLARGHTRLSKVRWIVECSCGEIRTVSATSLTRSKSPSRSCGCLPRNPWNKTHGESEPGTPEYLAWQGMRGRCLNPKNFAWKRYGGRGITICARWDRFENFLADMGRRPSLDHSLDRMNNNGNYEPGNCRWATRAQQNGNRGRRASF